MPSAVGEVVVVVLTPGSRASDNRAIGTGAPRIAACGAALAALALPSAALARGLPPAFSPGHWTGKLKVRGVVSVPGSSSQSSVLGGGQFSFTVTPGGQVVRGAVSVAESILIVSSSHTSTASTDATFPLQGDASRVVGAGAVHFHVDFGDPLIAPLDTYLPGIIYLEPTGGRCGALKGDAATATRAIQTASGLATNETALWTAHRSGGRSADQRHIASEFQSAISDIKRYLDDVAHRRQNSGLSLDVAANAVKSLGSAVAAAAACGQAPAGLANGLLTNPQLRPLLTRMFDAALGNSSSYQPSNTITALEAAVEIHFSNAYVRKLQTELAAQLAEPPWSTDKLTLQEVLTDAQQYHLDTVAAAAQQALGALGGP